MINCWSLRVLLACRIKKIRNSNTPTGRISRCVFSLCDVTLTQLVCFEPERRLGTTKWTRTCVCSLQWKVNILVWNVRSQETENKATPQTESSRVIINVMSTKKKKKKSIQFNSVCLKNISIQGWKIIHSSVSKGMKCMKGSTLQHLAMTSLARCLVPDGVLSPFSPTTQKQVV